MAGKNEESLNLNEFSNEISQNNLVTEGPPSPILSSSKINRRIIINRKLKKQKSRAKFGQQLEDDLNLNLSQRVNSPETRLKAIEELKTERRKYHDLLCNTNHIYEHDHIDMHKPKCDEHLHKQQSHIVFENGKKIYNCDTNQKEDSLTLKTASGKNIIIPEHIVNEYKCIFKDIFNDHILDSTILKCPVQLNLQKASKIPVLNRNMKLKSHVIQKPRNLVQYPQDHEIFGPSKINEEAGLNSTFSFSQGRKQTTYKKSIHEDFAFTESFLEAAQNIIEEEEDEEEVPNGTLNFWCKDTKHDSKSMSKLYSNQLFEECSSSSNSIESLKNPYTIHAGSEINIKSSEMLTNTSESVPSSNFKGIGNKILVMTTNECGALSVMDIVNDDWSDTMYVTKNNIMKDISEEHEQNYAKNEKRDEKNIVNNFIVDKNNTKGNAENRIVEISNETISEKNYAQCNMLHQDKSDNKVQNNVTSECDSNVENVVQSKTNGEEIKIQPVSFRKHDNNSDLQKTVSNSKSVIHVNIPVFDCKRKPPYSKNLIELHRNRNFLGNSEDSGSNIDYKFSEHSIRVRKKTVKEHKKVTDEDMYGFDKNSQESAKQRAIILFNNIKELEKEINDRELLVQMKNKEEKKQKDKKGKKYKSENGDVKEKDNHSCSREPKVKHDKKKKEKLKHGKLVPVEEIKPNGTFEEIKPNGTIEEITTNEEINRTVTYDHISIISEQSCKKYKGHKRRKSVTTDKEVVCQNNNDNQIIQISPNQKKFKIEIDCNNKFHINICCNGLQNLSDKISDKEIIKDVEDIDLNCKAIEVENTTSMFKSASGKDIVLSKKCLNDAEKKYEETDCTANAINDNILVKHDMEMKSTNKISRTEDVKNENTKFTMNESGKDKFITKILNKAHRLYHDITKSEMLSTINQQLDLPKDRDSNTKYLTKLKDKDLASSVGERNVEIKSKQKLDTSTHDFTASNFCGFKSASGKNLKVSERAIRRAQALYKDSDEKSNHQVDKTDCDATNSSMAKNAVKQRTRILYTDIDNSDCYSKIIVPQGYKFVSGKLMTDEIKNENACIVLNEETNHQNNIDVQEEHTASKKEFSCGFQSASGKGIKISSKMLEKAKHLFDEGSFPAGDASDLSPLAYGFKCALDVNEDVSEKSVLHPKEKQVHNNVKLCMGDFKEDLSGISTRNVAPYTFDGFSKSLSSNTSKKAFELLEDVVETVDCALEKIQKSKVHGLTNPKKRLGISKCKQINISREKIDKAKRLFSNDSLSDSIRDLSVLGTPFKNSQIGSSSTPLRSNMPLMKDVQFSKTTIEAEITPIKNINCDNINYETSNQKNLVIMQNRTPGTIDDWHRTILKQINSVKDTLKKLEDKKNSLEKQMSFVHYSNKDHKRQRTGVLYNNKTTNNQRVMLKTLKIANEGVNTQNNILTVIPKNADMIHFNSASLDNVNPTKDGATVIPNSQNLIGLSEIEMAFQTMIGVEPELIPKAWIANHYRLIVWKLTSYERAFPQELKGCLSIENIIQQLKYRYDREIDRAQRPAIRKMLEKDDISQKRIILCVSDIIEVPNSRMELELTDGWYCIRTIIDDPLIYQIKKGKIKIGTKLVTYGAQLLNCDGCHPLEVTDLVKLKISYNCTRRAIWHAKLGYQKCPEPFTIPLQSVHPDGGMIGCIQVHILRIYPIRYMEQIDNRKVWRNNKAEEKYSNFFENARLEKIEKIHYSVQEKFERDLCLDMKSRLVEGSRLNRTEISKITCPQVLFSLVESCNDPESLIEILSPSQRVDILEYRQQMCLQREQEISRRISEEMDKLKLTKRKVVPILKLLVLDDYSKSEKPQQFCIWNPKEDDMSVLKEGISLTVYNVVPRSNGDLFSNSKTYFRVNKTQTKMSHSKFKRNLLPISLVLTPYYQPIFNEFDTIGLVVQVNIGTHDQDIWISDSMRKMLFIKIKDGPEVCSLLDGIAKGHIISLLNLIYCKPQKDFGQAVANQFTTIISNFSQQTYLHEQLELFKMKLPEDLSKLLEECEQNIEKYKLKIDLKQNCFVTSFVPNTSKSFSSTFDMADDSTLIQSKLTATDVAMSLIDTDKFT